MTSALFTPAGFDTAACQCRRRIRSWLAALAVTFGFAGTLNAQTTYTPYDFATLAGVYGNQLGPVAEVRLENPLGITRDASGNFYLTEQGSISDQVPGFASGFNALLKITPAGNATILAGGSFKSLDGVGTFSAFGSPSGVAADDSGNVYVADAEACTIFKISPYGGMTAFAGARGLGGSSDGSGASAQFSSPNGLAIDGAGNVYVADSGNSTIRRISPGGVVTTVAGTPGVIGSADGTGAAAEFNNPYGLAIDGSGNLYVTDSGNDTVRKITPGGVVTTLAGSPGIAGYADGTGSSALFEELKGVAVDAAGNVFVCSGSIREITPAGVVTTVAQSLSDYSSSALGITNDSSGNIYVTDGFNGEVWKIAPGGMVSPFIGVANGIGFTDGAGAAARFNTPNGVAVDSGGNVYVADSRNNTIRKITPGGVASTLAGTAGAGGDVDATGAAARFEYPYSITVDNGGNVYVGDGANGTIRKITSGGVVTTIAGMAPLIGIADSIGIGPRLAPVQIDTSGVAVDTDGNIFVAAAAPATILEISPAGVVTPIALTGDAASMGAPSGIAIDRSGTLYIADTGNDRVLKISPGGAGVTLAGKTGMMGSVDGTGAAAQFNGPIGLALDPAGNVYVADTGNNVIRKITPGGVVTTLGGDPPQNGPGGSDGLGAAAQFNVPTGVAVDSNGNVYVADSGNNTLRVGAPGRTPSVPTEPSFTSQPSSQTVASGSSATFSASTGTVPLPSFQWSFDGIPIAGATNSTLLVAGATASSAGEYACVATNSLGASATSASLAVVNTDDPGRLINLSCRSQVGAGANVLIAGFVVGGAGNSGAESLLIRAAGPALVPFNVAGVLPDPDLQLMNSASGSVIASNSGWGGATSVIDAAAATGAFPWTNATSHDDALLEALSSGAYTAVVSGSNGDSGTALVEIYDATPAGSFSASTPRLINISARTSVGPGASELIAGFVIGGTTSKTVLIRASGPALETFGISGTLPDPQLQLYSSGSVVASNAGWGGSAEIAAESASAGAFTWGINATSDSALLVTLPPGAYTAEVSGISGDSGIALVEIYEVQ